MKKLLVVILVVGVITSMMVAGGKLSSVSAADDASILNKLEEVVSGQKAILKDLESIKSELVIIKVRITQQQ